MRRPAIPANTAGGGIFTRPDTEASLTPQQRAQRKKSQAEGAAVLRTAGNVLNTIVPGPQNPLLAAELEDIHNDPGAYMKAAAKGYFGLPSESAKKLTNTRAAVLAIERGDFAALNDRYLGLGAPHLAALRGPQAPPRSGSAADTLARTLPPEISGPYRALDVLRRYGGDPLRAAAAAALEHPYATAGAGLVADAINPLGNAPTDVARAGMAAAARGVGRSLSESAARLAAQKAAGGAAAARDATMASAMADGPLTIVPGARARDHVLAPLAKVAGAFSPDTTLARAARGAVDRYATQVGPNARYAAHDAEAAIGRAAKRVDDAVLKAFGPQVDHLIGNPVVQNAPEGLTRAEMLEVQNRSYQTRGTTLPEYVKDRDLEVRYYARMKAAGVANPISLDKRAGWVRQALVNNDRALVKYGVADPEQLYKSGIFFPMKQYRRRPVYSRFEEPKVDPNAPERAYNSDSVVPLSDLRFLGEGGGSGPRGGFVASRRFLSQHKTQPPTYLLDPSKIADDYLPSHQFREHLMQSQRAVEQAKALRKLEGVGIEAHGPGTQEYRDLIRIGLGQLDYRIANAKNDAEIAAAKAEKAQMTGVLDSLRPDSSPARLPILYAKREFGGATTVMGLGNSGRARAMRLEQRERNANTLTQAQMNVAPDRVDLRDGRRLTNVKYLEGAGRGRVAGAQDLANAARRVDTLADTLQGSRVPGQFPRAATFDQTTRTPFGSVTRGAPSSILDQFGEPVRRGTPFTYIANDLGATAGGLDREGGALSDAVKANREAGKPARDEAVLSGKAAKLYRSGEREIKSIRAADLSPSRRAIYDVARQQHGIEADEFVRLSPGRNSVTPDWTWDGKRWRIAGEFADVPKRYLDLSEKPQMPPTQIAPGNLVARVHGNLDEIATEAGHADGGELLSWLAAHPKPPRIGDYIENARSQVEDELKRAHATRSDEALARFGLQGHTLPEALKAIRNDARTLERISRDAHAEATGRRMTDRNIGPQARSTASVAQQAARTLRTAMTRVGSAQNGVVQRVTRLGDSLGKVVEKRLDEIDGLADKLAAARNDRDTYRKIKDEQQRLLGEMFDTVSEAVDKKWGKLPKGYLPELPLRLGARDSRAFGIEENLGRLLSEPVGDPTSRVHDNIKKFMRGMDTLSQAIRFGIVAVPTVHVGGNLQMAYLAEFASRGTPASRAAIIEESARILAGKGTAVRDAALAQRAEDAGALPGHSTTTIGQYDKRQADVMTRSRSEINPLEQVDQNVSHRFYRPSTALVFDHFEKAYAVDAFKRYTDAGMADNEAAYRVRQLFGNYQNITAFESGGVVGFQLSKLLMFYPWLKTAIHFWIKKGILDPNFAIIAPMRAVQTENSIQGYDDSSKPYTITMGRDETGEFRRLSLPLPQRILEPLGRAALTPYDTVRTLTDPSFAKSGRLAKDAASASSIVFNRLNPTAQQIHLAADNASGHAAPYERYFDPKSPTWPVLQTAGRVGQAFVAPLRNMTEFSGGDPMGAAISQAGLGYAYAVPGNGLTQKQIQAMKVRVDALRAAGRGAEADRVIAIMRRAQGAPR